MCVPKIGIECWFGLTITIPYKQHTGSNQDHNIINAEEMPDHPEKPSSYGQLRLLTE